jgi:hypothetical protein
MIARSTYFRGLHFGYNAPIGENEAAGAVLWFRVHPNHRLSVISEYAFTHELESDLAAHILSRDRALGLASRFAYTVANEECFSQQTKQPKGFIGEVIASVLARHGVPLVEADPDTFNGWQRVRNFLRDSPDGEPWLTIAASCDHLVRGLSSGLSDDTHPDQLSTYSPALQALRYAVMSQPTPDFHDELTNPPPGTPAAVMRELLSATDGRRFGEAR